MLYAKRWLQLIAIAHIIGGLMLPVVVQLDIAQPYFRLMANEFALSSQQDLLFLQFLVGIFGPWAVYDSIYSNFYGLWINAVINGVVFISIVVPLWRVRQEFE